jgi:tRNA(adenine34) deaminase
MSKENGTPSDDRLGSLPLSEAGASSPEQTTSAFSAPADEEVVADIGWMRLALDEAHVAAALGEVPVGAIIVFRGGVIATGHNLTATSNDPSAHAEMVAIRRAAQALGHWRLLECTLYVTLEPCTMCAGAIVLSRIPRLVFGASDPKAGMCGSLGNLVQDARLNHRVALTSGIMAGESGALLREFFRQRRGT